MPTNRKRKKRIVNALMPWEHAFLTGDLSRLRPGTRDAAKLKTMKSDPDSFLIGGDRTARQLLEDFPEYNRGAEARNKQKRVIAKKATQNFIVSKKAI